MTDKETQGWANDPNKRWPCSFLSGRRLRLSIAPNNDILDFAVNSGRGSQDCPGDELRAIVADTTKHH